jgi:branched-chain amino acid transport system ATP-binding protein
VLLEVSHLTVDYGTVRGLQDVSFSLDQGEAVALIGPNGAGKSTALKAVAGLLDATGGRLVGGDVIFRGRSITGCQTDELARKGIVLVPEGRRVFATMSVLENLEMGAYTRKNRLSIYEDIDNVFNLFPQLKERTRQKAGVLSTGEQQMLAIGRALMLRPKVLLADEPSNGLSPNYVNTILDKLAEINKVGTSLLIVEQNARLALDICSRAYIFELGRVTCDGKRETLLQDKKIEDIYLGR